MTYDGSTNCSCSPISLANQRFPCSFARLAIGLGGMRGITYDGLTNTCCAPISQSAFPVFFTRLVIGHGHGGEILLYDTHCLLQ